jgi:hypothetical protein
LKANRRQGWKTFAAALLALGGLATRADAGVLILSASAPEVTARYRSGAIVDAGAIQLNPGEWLQVIVDGKTRRLSGPTSVQVKPSSALDTAVLQRISAAMDRNTSRHVEFGAVRGAREVGSARPDDPWSIDISRSSVVCVTDPAKVMLWRPDPAGAMHASLEDLTNNERRYFDWPAGAAAASWPSELALRGGAYIFRDANGASKHIQIAVIDRNLKDAALLAGLAENDCWSQFGELANP